jgi:hypothetical protein
MAGLWTSSIRRFICSSIVFKAIVTVSLYWQGHVYSYVPERESGDKQNQALMLLNQKHRPENRSNNGQYSLISYWHKTLMRGVEYTYAVLYFYPTWGWRRRRDTVLISCPFLLPHFLYSYIYLNRGRFVSPWFFFWNEVGEENLEDNKDAMRHKVYWKTKSWRRIMYKYY